MMNFSIICSQSVFVNNNEINKISTLSSIYAFFFKKYLEKYNYIVNCLDICQINNDMESYDNCFITFNRGTQKLDNITYNILRSKIKNKIITICETNKIVGCEDILLYYIGKRKPKCLKIHWMADSELLFTQKNPDKITILVDHIYYGKNNSRIYLCDKTRLTIESLLEYKKTSSKQIDIYHISSMGINLINSMNDVHEFKQGFSMNYYDIVKYYNMCDIFVNTHHESMGLTNLECAMGGALILTFDDFLKNEFSSLIYHYKVSNNIIDWNDIIKSINIKKSLNMSKKFTYASAVDILVEHLKNN